jgi:hypothetical protein
MLVVLAFSLAIAPAARSAPDGRPEHPKSLGFWSHHDPDPRLTRDGYEPWTASDVVGFLTLLPDTYVDLSWGDGKGPGQTTNARLRALANEAQAIAAARGVNVDRRLCLSERPDVFTRLDDTLASCHPSRGGGGCDWEGNMDGRFGEAETVVKVAGTATDGDSTHLIDANASWTPELYRHRLVVLRPGAGEERRRIVASDVTFLRVDAAWSSPPAAGDRYEIRGSFDPRWVMQVPRSVHDAAVVRFWEGARTRCAGGVCAPLSEPLDPFAAANRRGWESWVSRSVFQSLANATTVPAIYGYAYDGNAIVNDRDVDHAWTDPYFRASSVVMDLTNPAYREWRARYLLYKLAEFGLDPGEPACVVAAYKPGYHAYYDEAANGPATKVCSVPETGNWFGPVHVCRNGASFGGPMHPTQYGRGEFEAGISAYFRELLRTLASNGRGDTRIITGEAPQYRDRDWTTLADDVRRDPRMREQQGGWLHPPLSSLAALAGDGEAPPGDSGTGTPGTGNPDPIPGGDGGATPVEDPDDAPSGGGIGSGSSQGAAGGPATQSRASAVTGGDDADEFRGDIVRRGGGGGGGGTIEPPDAP